MIDFASLRLVEGDLVDGVGAVFIRSDHIVSVNVVNVPRVLNFHLGMLFKISKRSVTASCHASSVSERLS